MAPQAKRPEQNQKWKIGESVLDVLVGGVSFLDSKDGFKGSFVDHPSAEKFLQAYGYDIIDPIELAELQGSMQEAIRFIKRYFLKPENPDGLALEVPKKLNDLLDVRELLLYASSDANSELRNWACAVLRLVHTISHVDRDIRTHYFGEIQKQIFDRFYRHLHRDEVGQLYLGRTVDDPLRVNLVEFQVKPKKARDSTLMKLLHKPESVAEELFDRVGLRFVTRNRVDSIRVVHFLEQSHVIVAANIKPSRSRNTLIDTQAFRERLSQGLNRGDDEAALDRLLEETPYPASKNGENTFSSDHYRAIQFTCRQLIKVRNSLADEIRELKQVSKGQELSPSLQAVIDKLDPRQIQRVIRFFYPFEIQVMDETSFIENEKGRSAHHEYKKAQQQTALVRVMGPLA
jgi:uncharacterized protein (TIGR04562 family)